MPSRLLLLRHGQSTWNAAGRWQGWADPPLSTHGEEQAVEAARRLERAGLTTVVSSDLIRARRTAELLAEALGIQVVATEPALRERDVGDWCGLTQPEIEAGWPGLLEAWRDGRLAATPGGESRQGLLERVMGALERLADDDGLGHQPLVVTHSGPVKAVERRLGVSSPTVGNMSGRWIERDPEPRLETEGDGADVALRAGEPVILLGDHAQTLSPSP